ncbi:methyltransferase [Clostridia bacterium]|nr:methyltransferase [Clostridia bacterium]
MESYVSFAQVYDLFMDNVPYLKWSEYLLKLLDEQGVQEGIVVDLACGTGKITRELAKAGYDMIGIDQSEDMLRIAQEKEKDSSILYLLQDMRSFELYGTVRAVLTICDSLNYLLKKEEWEAVAKLVKLYLDPGGVWIFDFHTPDYYEALSGEVLAEQREEGSFIWENIYEKESKLHQAELTFFLPIKKEQNLYQKTTEIHSQRAMYLEEVQEILVKAGLIFLEAYSGFEEKKAQGKEERILVICKKEE